MCVLHTAEYPIDIFLRVCPLWNDNNQQKQALFTVQDQGISVVSGRSSLALLWPRLLLRLPQITEEAESEISEMVNFGRRICLFHLQFFAAWCILQSRQSVIQTLDFPIFLVWVCDCTTVPLNAQASWASFSNSSNLTEHFGGLRCSQQSFFSCNWGGSQVVRKWGLLWRFAGTSGSERLTGLSLRESHAMTRQCWFHPISAERTDAVCRVDVGSSI